MRPRGQARLPRSPSLRLSGSAELPDPLLLRPCRDQQGAGGGRRLLDRPELLRRVGERAQQDLYLSWEDAVDNAWEGYGAVIDKYRRGLYQRPRNTADEAFHSLGTLMERLGRLDARRSALEELSKTWTFEEFVSFLHRRDLPDLRSTHRSDRFL